MKIVKQFQQKIVMFTAVKIAVCCMGMFSKWLPSEAKACFTLIVRPFGRAFLSWVTERRCRETDRRQFHTESHLT